MKEYLEQVMHHSIDERRYEETEKLPLGCRNAFDLKILKIRQQEFLLASPVQNMSLSELRKKRLQLERYTGYVCAFYLKKVNWYAAPKMVEEGIPFVWENHQLYLPFMGILLKENAQRVPQNCTMISFLTQKLLLKALYENWKDVSAIQAAELLNVSRMSITRCYDEIEALGMPFLKTKKRSRRFYAMEDKKTMWNTMIPFMRNPVIRTFKPEKRPETEMLLSGTSALAHYSMLGEESCITYAIRKDQIVTSGIKEIREVPQDEEPACYVQEVGYILPFGDGKAIDPLSLSLMLTEEDLADPRVESCRNEMLKELVW